ncbi:MAG: Mu-like prophage major head subunit gpT family protein, partial [Firmicutes bacterium]|nr:Mu-like prophage major head subunit gpT family protein [Bacillota bacterium]
TLEQARAQVLDEISKRNQPLTTNVQIMVDESDKVRDAASDAIIMRAGGNLEKPADGAKELRGMRLRDLAVDCLSRAGVTNAHRLDDVTLIQRALSPDSQFGSILSTTVHKSMAKAYSALATTYQAWTATGSAVDFKDAEVWQISEAGELKPMTQQGEFQFDEMQDTRVTKRIATFGREFGITRQAIINDDIGILTRIPEAYVRASNRGINKMVYQLLQDNDKIYDGKPLFDNAHKNLAPAASALSIASLGEAKMMMRKQTNLRGMERLNISPKTLIIPPELEVAALQLMQSTADPNGNHAGVANIFRNALSIVVDAELTNPTAWYLAASPTDIDTIEVTYLNGDAMPKLESQVGFDYLGIKYRIYMDYGVNVLDYRGLYKNAGK